MRRLEGRTVTCVPEQLRLHQVLDELGWTRADELNDAARLKEPASSRTDSYHDGWDNSRWLWAVAVSVVRA